MYDVPLLAENGLADRPYDVVDLIVDVPPDIEKRRWTG